MRPSWLTALACVAMIAAILMPSGVQAQECGDRKDPLTCSGDPLVRAHTCMWCLNDYANQSRNGRDYVDYNRGKCVFPTASALENVRCFYAVPDCTAASKDTCARSIVISNYSNKNSKGCWWCHSSGQKKCYMRGYLPGQQYRCDP